MFGVSKLLKLLLAWIGWWRDVSTDSCQWKH